MDFESGEPVVETGDEAEPAETPVDEGEEGADEAGEETPPAVPDAA